MGYLVHYLTAFIATMAFIVALRRPALAIGLVDLPGGRKRHKSPIPLVGGLAMLLGFTVALALLWPFPLRLYGGQMAGMAFMAAVGVVDDRLEISARHRFLAQAIAALIMTEVSGIRVLSLGDLFGMGELVLGFMSLPVTVLFVLALVNAINMADGFDGLAGSIVLVSLLGLAVIGGLAGLTGHATPLILVLSWCIAGFLVFNLRTPWRRRASVFMGDAGSMMLGFALAWFAVYTSLPQGMAVPPMVFAWVLAFPVFDTSSVIIRRLREGRSPVAPARDHMHHELLNAGWSVARVVSVLTLVAAGCAAIGIIGWLFGAPDWLLFVGFIATGAVHLWVMLRGAKYLRFMGRRV